MAGGNATSIADKPWTDTTPSSSVIPRGELIGVLVASGFDSNNSSDVFNLTMPRARYGAPVTMSLYSGVAHSPITADLNKSSMNIILRYSS